VILKQKTNINGFNFVQAKRKRALKLNEELISKDFEGLEIFNELRNYQEV
jgi:hypothetical protein